MILIADSGSTKTDWAVVEQGKLQQVISTKGINPFFQTEEEIADEIGTALLPHIKTETPLTKVFFYGAGCIPEKAPMMKQALGTHLSPIHGMEIYSDMLAVAHSLCGHTQGIACILGTGSNSCFYDGNSIVENVSPLGFILGDEGSGAVLGRLLVGDILKNQLTPELKEKFLSKFQLTQVDIIDRVYRKPFPNRFLASLSPFLLEHIDEPRIYKLVKSGFRAFFKRNVMQYDYKNNPIYMIGSIAYYYQDVLKEAATELGITINKIEKSPLMGLIDYHKDDSLKELSKAEKLCL